MPFSRRINFNLFWWTHQLYIPFYFLMILHGSAQLVQPPIFFFYLLGPRFLFSIDKLVAYAQVSRDLPVVRALLLPSGVLSLEFKKPADFNYRSGQYVRLRCNAVSGWELHPMTLTSAPYEKHLTLHIRTLGAWTNKLRQLYQDALATGDELPPINIEGPYGHDHQDWFNYPVVVLVGGGIGVTPFVSILKDMMHQTKRVDSLRTKKVYFIWVCRTQKQFEWLVDIIRQLEDEDVDGILECHIFITQLYKKFDLRTTLLYICERQFHKINNRSLFTGLEATTHFGRPVFPAIFHQLSSQHQSDANIGVFSCGPRSLLRAVDEGITEARAVSQPGDPVLHHSSLTF
jgi:dual oxidase